MLLRILQKGNPDNQIVRLQSDLKITSAARQPVCSSFNLSNHHFVIQSLLHSFNLSASQSVPKPFQSVSEGFTYSVSLTRRIRQTQAYTVSQTQTLYVSLSVSLCRWAALTFPGEAPLPPSASAPWGWGLRAPRTGSRRCPPPAPPGSKASARTWAVLWGGEAEGAEEGGHGRANQGPSLRLRRGGTLR